MPPFPPYVIMVCTGTTTFYHLKRSLNIYYNIPDFRFHSGSDVIKTYFKIS